MSLDDQFIAAAQGDVEWLKECLDRSIIQYDCDGFTPVHIAAFNGQLKCLKYLIEEYGCNVDVLSISDWTPLLAAVNDSNTQKSLDCLKYLLERGADISVSNKDGTTVLHRAAQKNHVEILKYLLGRGAELNCKDKDGYTPGDLAKILANKECSRILEAAKWHENKKHLAKQMNQLSIIKYQIIHGQRKYTNIYNEKDPTLNETERQKSENETQTKPSKKPIKKTVKYSKSTVKKKRSAPASYKWNYEKSTEKGEFQKYIPNLNDEYPRDFYTQMPKVPGANKYYDGKHKDTYEIPENLLEYLDMEFEVPDLPREIIAKALSRDPSLRDRPVVFNCKNVLDVETKLQQKDNKNLKHEVGLHLSNDCSSYSFINALQPETKMRLEESLGDKIIKTPLKKKSKTSPKQKNLFKSCLQI
ncbi:delta-latroinsectotoxin-Lt1a-like [Octopus sinensis]|uniref:Delta-latroinsectotoxin-Lt1a-like n=1 Tax=Octopus sinensis TaxID=2607531 RepID=A0A6P7T4G3_9MOLL|nr:delta-latroinsectotoxin-Lt1a-like [Octopus sinensis]XP_036364878.1 delta-latroinsectotoxin-Lt1a-like [Octopus sinensis]